MCWKVNYEKIVFGGISLTLQSIACVMDISLNQHQLPRSTDPCISPCIVTTHAPGASSYIHKLAHESHTNR